MIELGVFARVFPSGQASQVAGMIRAAGFTATQLNLSALNRPTLDQTLCKSEAVAIAQAFRGAGVRIWGVSGTFNAIHPDLTTREAGVQACRSIIARAADMGAEVVTLCTGTRDRTNKWRAHADNSTPAAWQDLRITLDSLIPTAIEAGVRLGVEPEPGNVICDAKSAIRLFAELNNDAHHLAVVLDPANLLSVHTLPRQRDILSEAFDGLGNYTAALHAKDVVSAGYAAPGMGGLDYELVMRLHASLPRLVPVIAQDLTADDAPRVAAFLAERAASAASGSHHSPAAPT